MEPVDRSPPGGGPLRKPPKHPTAALPGAWQKARLVCEKILSADSSTLNSFECTAELARSWEDLQKSGEIPLLMVKQFQTTLSKLKSLFEETIIPEELQSLSSDVDQKRLEQIYKRILHSDRYIDPEDLESLGKEVLKIWENAKVLESGITPLSKVIVLLATKAVSLHPTPTFLALQGINIDHIYEKLKKKPELFSKIDHAIALESILKLYRLSSGELTQQLSEKIVFIGNHLLLTSDDKDLRAIIDRLTPTVSRGPDLLLLGEKGSSKNFEHMYTFLLTNRPSSMREAGRLVSEFLTYYDTHQYGVTIKQAAKMHSVAYALSSIIDDPHLERVVSKIKSCIAQYEEELAEELKKLSS